MEQVSDSTLRYAVDEQPPPGTSALLQAIPAPVLGAFVSVFMILLFAHGLRLVFSGGFSYENGIVFGVSFWLGAGFQSQALFADLVPDWAHNLFDDAWSRLELVAEEAFLFLTEQEAGTGAPLHRANWLASELGGRCAPFRPPGPGHAGIRDSVPPLNSIPPRDGSPTRRPAGAPDECASRHLGAVACTARLQEPSVHGFRNSYPSSKKGWHATRLNLLATAGAEFAACHASQFDNG